MDHSIRVNPPRPRKDNETRRAGQEQERDGMGGARRKRAPNDTDVTNAGRRSTPGCLDGGGEEHTSLDECRMPWISSRALHWRQHLGQDTISFVKTSG